MKKIFIVIIILAILIVATASFFLIKMQVTRGVITDDMPIYDDFESGFRNDLWDITFTGLTDVSNGEARTRSNGHPNCINNYQRGDFISKRLWFDEDLKVIYSYNYNIRPTCPSVDTPILRYGVKSIVLSNGEQNIFGGNYEAGYIHIQNNAILEIIHFDPLDRGRYVVKVNGKEIIEGVNTVPVELSFGSGLIVEEVRFKPFLSCNIDRTKEVVVSRKFDGGQNISQSDLIFFDKITSKYCSKDLGVFIISPTSLGNKGSLTDSLARGETLTIPQDEHWEVFYITPYVQGMGNEFCGIGQVYNENMGGCRQIAQEPVIIELPVTEVTTINDGINSIVFNSRLGIKIADRDWLRQPSIALMNQCPVANGEFLSPSKTGCYQSGLKWAGYTDSLLNGIEKTISPNLKAEYTLTGRGVFNGDRGGTFYDYEFLSKNDDSSREHIFKITFTDIFDIKETTNLDLVNLNEQTDMCFIIDNKLHDFDNSGYSIAITKDRTGEHIPSVLIQKPIKKGSNQFCVSAPTDTTGINLIKITPYFDMFNNELYFSDEEISIAYVVIEKGAEPPIIITPKEDFTILFIIIGILAAAVIILIFIFMRQKK